MTQQKNIFGEVIESPLHVVRTQEEQEKIAGIAIFFRETMLAEFPDVSELDWSVILTIMIERKMLLKSIGLSLYALGGVENENS